MCDKVLTLPYVWWQHPSVKNKRLENARATDGRSMWRRICTGRLLHHAHSTTQTLTCTSDVAESTRIWNDFFYNRPELRISLTSLFFSPKTYEMHIGVLSSFVPCCLSYLPLCCIYFPYIWFISRYVSILVFFYLQTQNSTKNNGTTGRMPNSLKRSGNYTYHLLWCLKAFGFVKTANFFYIFSESRNRQFCFTLELLPDNLCNWDEMCFLWGGN